jgi:hypothetical protein
MNLLKNLKARLGLTSKEMRDHPTKIPSYGQSALWEGFLLSKCGIIARKCHPSGRVLTGKVFFFRNARSSYRNSILRAKCWRGRCVCMCVRRAWCTKEDCGIRYIRIRQIEQRYYHAPPVTLSRIVFLMINEKHFFA